MLEKQGTEDMPFGRNPTSFPSSLQQLRAPYPALENDCPFLPQPYHNIPGLNTANPSDPNTANPSDPNTALGCCLTGQRAALKGKKANKKPQTNRICDLLSSVYRWRLV